MRTGSKRATADSAGRVLWRAAFALALMFSVPGCVHSLRPDATELATSGATASASLETFYGDMIDRMTETADLRTFNDVYSGIGKKPQSAPQPGDKRPDPIDCTDADRLGSASDEQLLVCRIEALSARKRLAHAVGQFYVQLGALATMDEGGDVSSRATELAASLNSALKVTPGPKGTTPNFAAVGLITGAIATLAQNKQIVSVNKLAGAAATDLARLVEKEADLYDGIYVENATQRSDLVKLLAGSGSLVVWPALQHPIHDMGLTIASPDKPAAAPVNAAFLEVLRHRDLVRRATVGSASETLVASMNDLAQAHAEFPKKGAALVRAQEDTTQLAALIKAIREFGKPIIP